VGGVTPYDLLLAPFVDHQSMRLALAAIVGLSLSACPIGVFLSLRRMSLAADAMGHAILPGAAAAFVLAGMSLAPMALGGFAAGLAVALLTGLVARASVLPEDASLAALYPVALALGVLLITWKGSSEEAMHVLFGTALDLNSEALILVALVVTATLVTLVLIWRGLVAECLDPVFLRIVSPAGRYAHVALLVLLVLNLVGAFRALGTLTAVGLMMLPAIAARFWSGSVGMMAVVAAAIGIGAGGAGLILSYHLGVEAGPAVVVVAGAVYGASALFGPRGLLATQSRRGKA
jgi:zinc/manganese transport system permease protein